MFQSLQLVTLRLHEATGTSASFCRVLPLVVNRGRTGPVELDTLHWKLVWFRSIKVLMY